MPDALLVLVAVALIAVLVPAAILLRRRGGGSDLVPPDLATRAPSTPPPLKQSAPGPAEPAALVAEVQELMRAGRKINAVKVMRERTGLSLADAKAAVEEVERSGRLPARPGPPPAIDQVTAKPELHAQLRHLKASGRPIEAIKLLRSHTAISLKEAKDTIDRL